MFLNPGIRKIPTWGFVSLITLFAICIGPLNYWYLRRRNKLSQLLWTTPLIALTTSSLLIIWSTLANGSSNHVRLRSLSILDQDSQSMVSQTHIAMFSGVTPDEGLRFEPNSAVMPIWQTRNIFRSGSVDWTDAQVLKGNFHRGNSRSQFYVTTPRTERGRLQVEKETSAGVTVNNGLEWNIRFLLLRSTSGEYFFGQDLEAGQSMVLSPAIDMNVQSIRDRIASQKLKAPTLRRPPTGMSGNVNPAVISHMGSAEFSGRLDTNIFESYFNRYKDNLAMEIETTPHGEVIDHGIPNSSYLAVLSEQPDLDVGLQTYRTTDELHVLLGLF